MPGSRAFGWPWPSLARAMEDVVIVAGEETTRRTLRTLVITGALILFAIGLLTILYANFPPGVRTPSGINFTAVRFFRLVWGYPEVALSPGVFQLVGTLGFLLFWGAYLFGLWTVSRLPEGLNTTRLLALIFGFALVFNLVLVFYFPPILSGDVFHYALQGRLWAVHGVNPYAPATAVDDPFWPLAIWRGKATQYGPVWIQISSICADLGAGSVLLTVFLFKFLAGLSNILGGVLIVVLTRRLLGGDGIVPLLFYAWNPLLLLESGGNAHNDSVMMLLALFGVFLLTQKRFMLGIAALVGSALIKYVTALLLGLLVIYLLARQSSLLRLSLALRMGLFIAFLLIFFYSPFLMGVPDPTQLIGGMSPTLNPMPNNAGEMARQLTGAVLQLAGVDPAAYVDLALNAAFGVFVLLLLPGMLAPEATFADVVGRFGAAALVYTLLIYGGSFPWYLVCPMTALAVAPPTRTTLYLRLLTIGIGIGFTMNNIVLIPQ